MQREVEKAMEGEDKVRESKKREMELLADEFKEAVGKKNTGRKES